MPTIHIFYDTGEAYDASQCRDEIKNGDILIASGEKVVGILMGAWPCAVTKARYHFHSRSLLEVANKAEAYAESIKLAEEEARKQGWEVTP